MNVMFSFGTVYRKYNTCIINEQVYTSIYNYIIIDTVYNIDVQMHTRTYIFLYT